MFDGWIPFLLGAFTSGVSSFYLFRLFFFASCFFRLLLQLCSLHVGTFHRLIISWYCKGIVHGLGDRGHPSRFSLLEAHVQQVSSRLPIQPFSYFLDNIPCRHPSCFVLFVQWLNACLWSRFLFVWYLSLFTAWGFFSFLLCCLFFHHSCSCGFRISWARYRELSWRGNECLQLRLYQVLACGYLCSSGFSRS